MKHFSRISEKNWINLVQYSFISKIMNPTTSYLVVENEAQKAMLKKKQEQDKMEVNMKLHLLELMEKNIEFQILY